MKYFFVALLTTLFFSLNQPIYTFNNWAFAKEEKRIETVEDFYKNNVDKRQYKEFNNSKYIIRNKTTIKGLSKIFKEMDWEYEEKYRQPIYGDFLEYTKRFDPNRQVYYFLSLKELEEKVIYKIAMYDVETKELIYSTYGRWMIEKGK